MASTIALAVVSRWLPRGAGTTGCSVTVMAGSSGEDVRRGVGRVGDRAVLGEGDRLLDAAAGLLLELRDRRGVGGPRGAQGVRVHAGRIHPRCLGELGTVGLGIA